jgi:hypothetical protein
MNAERFGSGTTTSLVLRTKDFFVVISHRRVFSHQASPFRAELSLSAARDYSNFH